MANRALIFKGLEDSHREPEAPPKLVCYCLTFEEALQINVAS